MCHIKKFSKENGSIEHEEGSVVYCKVTPVFSEGEPPVGYQPEGSCFLYEDYSAQLKPGIYSMKLFGLRSRNMLVEKALVHGSLRSSLQNVIQQALCLKLELFMRISMNSFVVKTVLQITSTKTSCHFTKVSGLPTSTTRRSILRNRYPCFILRKLQWKLNA